VDEHLATATLRLNEVEEERSMFEEGAQLAVDVVDGEGRALEERRHAHAAELDTLSASAVVLTHVCSVRRGSAGRSRGSIP